VQSLATINSNMMIDPRNWPSFKLGDDIAGNEHPAFFTAGADGRYCDIAPYVGLGDPILSRGIAVADIDGDGRLDLVFANQWEDSFVLRNDSKGAGSFLGLNLIIPLDRQSRIRVYQGMPKRDRRYLRAIGASATFLVPDGRRLTAQIDGGSGHSGKRSQDLHFGLGKLSRIKALPVEIAWRDRRGTPRKETISVQPGWNTVELPGGLP